VGDVHQASLGLTGESAVYLPTQQSNFTDRTLWLVAQTQGDPAALGSAIRNAIWTVDREQPITRISTMDDIVRNSAAQRRFVLIIFDVFALAALLLAGIGLYGVLAAIVNVRVREIGVRAALGASRGLILRMVIGQGVALTGFGLAIGLAAGTAAARAIRSLLFGVSEFDPITYGGVLLVMLLACAVASWLPAARAARVEPVIALRAD
jgi:putative ABC transport system permease protein